MQDEVTYKILKAIEENPEQSQRQLSNALGISLGKLNYCLKALVEKGWVKAGNFHKSSKKQKYLYLLTPKGIEEKTRVTVRFLRRKVAEYEKLKSEIEELRKEAN